MARTKHALLIGINEYRHLDGRDLEGAFNDVVELYHLLRDHFAFPKQQVVGYIDDEESTRDVLLGAFEDLCARVKPGDVAVVYYSGHGSSHVQDGRTIESLMPADSGRPAPHGDGSPNRDIYDFEIQRYLEILRQKTPWLTTIFDSCHSGSVTRDPFVRGVRAVSADPRPLALPGGAGSSRGFSAGPSSGSRHGVSLAACRADEKAKETTISVEGQNHRHGAFSYQLCQALVNASPGVTWRGLFEDIAPRVTAKLADQHPQIEGEWNVKPFDTRIKTPQPYVRVLGVDRGPSSERVRLAGGAAHGLRTGSLYSLQPNDALHPSQSAEIARLEVEAVAAGASSAAVRHLKGSLEPGQRAFPLATPTDRPGLRVQLDARGLSETERRRSMRYLERSTLLDDPVDPSETPADALIRLRDETWTVIGEDGSRLVRTRPRDDASIPRLVRDLEAVARYRKLLEINNPAEHELREGITLRLLRRQGEQFIEAKPEPGDGLPFFAWGEKMEIVVENRLDRAVWASLLQFGCDFSIDLLLPHRNHRHYKPGSVRLEAGSTLRLAQDYHSDSRVVDLRGGFTITKPEDFPWQARPETDAPDSSPRLERGLVHVRLMVTEAETDFEFLTGRRARDPGEQVHPLLALARSYASGKGHRDLTSSALSSDAAARWAVVSKAITVGEPRNPSP